ncbi:unnamed protein product [Anisakis simplex]|uniref:Deoxyribodipyrimidine photo-lyase n=1 Tax=Anisakis simplex TaxID=6269 RepID=A0A0M3J1K5_ANISI|nr:unnamed protein product [Anisakis simplex]
MNELKVKLLCVKEKNYTETLKEVHKLTDNACEVVIDAAYLRNDRDFEDSLNDQLIKSCRRLTRVEANVSVPVNVSSNQQEFGARTLRPKVWQHVKAMMKEKWEDVPTEPCKDWKKLVKADDLKEMDLEAELKKAESECKSDSGLTGGEKAAKKMLDFFITNRLVNYHPGSVFILGTCRRLETFQQISLSVEGYRIYAVDVGIFIRHFRNVPGSKYQSVLSPYLHFGMLSTIETIKRAKEGKAAKHPIDSFIEELLVRRDLAHNFVYYARKNYDSLDSLPDWAKKTLKEHKNDKREYVYSYEELENAKTHDVYWNAAQLEMIHTNKMHGYMRMYWGKKVIEWTPDYETAYKFLIEQNDKYELDGRDPNGYTGVMWNFGLHDRAHAVIYVFLALIFTF